MQTKTITIGTAVLGVSYPDGASEFSTPNTLLCSYADSAEQIDNDDQTTTLNWQGMPISVSQFISTDPNVGTYFAIDVIEETGSGSLLSELDNSGVPKHVTWNGNKLEATSIDGKYYLAFDDTGLTAVSTNKITFQGTAQATGISDELILNDSGFTTDDIDTDPNTGGLDYKSISLGGVPITVGRVGFKYYLIINRIPIDFSVPFAFSDNFSSSSLRSDWEQVDNTPNTDAIITAPGGTLSITVKDCIDIWISPDDDYAAIYLPITGDFEAIVKMDSQTGNEWTKCGIMTKIDMSTKGGADATGRKAYSIIAATPVNVESGFIFQWDNNDDGYLDESTHAPINAVSYPCWLKTTRVDRRITGYFSTDGVNYTQRGTVEFAIPNITDTIDVGIFAGGIVTVGLTTSTTAFDSFTIRSI